MTVLLSADGARAGGAALGGRRDNGRGVVWGVPVFREDARVSWMSICVQSNEGVLSA
jgi:hypothetical protein